LKLGAVISPALLFLLGIAFAIQSLLYLLICGIEPSLHQWNEVKLIMVHDIFNVLLNLACKYFIEFLRLCLSKKFIYNFIFVVSLSNFGVRVILAL
jgi:hypothetical protein